MRGTHPKRTSKADSKNISGTDLRYTLSPVEDQTFALSSARSRLVEDPARRFLVGTIGTTPTQSLVWIKKTGTFGEFVAICRELINLLVGHASIETSDVSLPFPVLSRPIQEWRAANGAYEISCAVSSDVLEVGMDANAQEQAQLLERAELTVTGRGDSAEFEVDLAVDGSSRGTARGSFIDIRDNPKLCLNLSESSDPPMAARLLNALRCSPALTVYFATGHVFTQDRFYKANVQPFSFPNWRWADFAGFDVSSEKPVAANGIPDQIHRMTGIANDTSIFSWVVAKFNDGWLVCDDGPGEVADFINVTASGTLQFIHVKAATSSAPGRQVSASAYEVVLSQAVKNALFLDTLRLSAAVSSSAEWKAAWTGGVRTPGRAEFLEALSSRTARDRVEVIIIQPHMLRDVYDRVHAAPRNGVKSENLLRLERLETLLNGGRPSFTGAGADLLIFGCA